MGEVEMMEVFVGGEKELREVDCVDTTKLGGDYRVEQRVPKLNNGEAYQILVGGGVWIFKMHEPG